LRGLQGPKGDTGSTWPQGLADQAGPNGAFFSNTGQTINAGENSLALSITEFATGLSLSSNAVQIDTPDFALLTDSVFTPPPSIGSYADLFASSADPINLYSMDPNGPNFDPLSSGVSFGRR